ncbi:oxalate/formate MFS antiporter [Paraburkholderia caballeronis]|uniref:MFS transporter, OFA family, oxalate/formate antiporter n=1 Tax=Paraburkholderia caballeronis TaxID=416943 RepID=A0A1H7QP61_9BURK|nr:oxalate/formate MFS antiporter [Paraburkholderia caballeronis]PXW22472.1 OFA family oxalate/formate antiporter-like MFS transporter [Paraburkholderia caballeronis]PXW96343.1 OFA family oxalate/formate antiporter-like MFS transporter [Paraburkholderia caballeronis]RAJ92754.1 OFA family oxalate/formate antiporter-like MFS transporter [Paraburkholderia caballeronis]TDV34460.1 OFA family oxalate/formate antiporter-like MFS transporter [Paraburkholderia caballeronis]SEE02639.1 MFS transporter, O
MNAISQRSDNGPFWTSRWWQLVIGMLCMALVANLQYAWTLFVAPMNARHQWGEASIQLAFSIFILTETWLVPLEGWLVDRFGPRPVVAVGAICAGLSWVMNSYLTTLPMLYVSAVIAGIGAAGVYGTCVGNALKWFPDRRGLAAGLTAAGFGAGAAVTVIPIANMITRSGYEHAFFVFGIIQGIAIFVLAFLLVKPSPRMKVAPGRRLMTRIDYTPGQMVKQPVFWVMYVAFVAVAAGGLMATAQIGPIAKDWGLARIPMSVFGLTTLPLLTLTLSIDNICNGFTRPLCGFVSDKIGRENAMFIIFVGEGVALLGMMHFGTNPYAFMFFAALIFLFWGEIFSIFPAICADTFGSKYAASNAGTLYTAKGTASLLVPIASVLATTGGWSAVFIAAAVITIAAGVSAKFILAPMRQRLIESADSPIASTAAAATIGTSASSRLSQTGE